MNLHLKIINDWAIDNRLPINTKKTKYMLFNYKKNFNDFSSNAILKIGSFEIEMVKSFKLLGLIIDNKLKFKGHIDKIVITISRNIGIINRIKFNLTRTTLLTLYYSLIFSHIYYCNILWGSTFKTYLNKIYGIQKKFLKIINYPQTIFIISNNFNYYNILTIFELNILKSCCFFSQLIQNKFSFLNNHIKSNHYINTK